MTYQTFIFESYDFDPTTGHATFRYSFDGQQTFTEIVEFSPLAGYDGAILDRALRLAFIVAGVSYYKAFFAPEIEVKPFALSARQAKFFNAVYYHGLSQYIYENQLDPAAIATFVGAEESKSLPYSGDGKLVLQSGGKDSLLLAELLLQKHVDFTTWFVAQPNGSYPAALDEIGAQLRTVKRTIDTDGLKTAEHSGGLNGHVPVTQIILAYALIDAILHGDNTVLAALGREGEEPHAHIAEYAVMHQWAKTWQAELLLAEYVACEISPDIHVGSPIRGLSELKIAQLFVEHCWEQYGHSFSSCNLANYIQGHDNTTLSWCGNCPKCANSFLLFAPFVEQNELIEVFGNDLFAEHSLFETFKGLLGIGDVMKPFECVGEIDELRQAYHMALHNGHTLLPFKVPSSDFEIDAEGPAQQWAHVMIKY